MKDYGEKHNVLAKHEDLTQVVHSTKAGGELSWANSSKEYAFDCSCGCRWFIPLEAPMGADWGVCSCRKSPRAGLLTFEHQGCDEFKSE